MALGKTIDVKMWFSVGQDIPVRFDQHFPVRSIIFV